MIECKINGKKYIGGSSDIHARKLIHKSRLKHNKNTKYLQKDVNLYGIKNFTFKIIKKCNKDNLIKYEQSYINKYKSYNREFGYNVVKKAVIPIMSESTKKKIGRKKYLHFEDIWKNLLLQGYSYSEIGRMYNVQNCVVRRYTFQVKCTKNSIIKKKSKEEFNFINKLRVIKYRSIRILKEDKNIKGVKSINTDKGKISFKIFKSDDDTVAKIVIKNKYILRKSAKFKKLTDILGWNFKKDKLEYIIMQHIIFKTKKLKENYEI